jgi:hypothetical protein
MVTLDPMVAASRACARVEATVRFRRGALASARAWRPQGEVEHCRRHRPRACARVETTETIGALHWTLQERLTCGH